MKGCEHVRVALLLWIFHACVCSSEHWNTESFTPVENGVYCHYETFTAECKEGSSLVIGQASYGQMGIGKCVDFDTGYLGCQTDVTDIVRDECSGKQTCTLPADDQALRNTEPCRRGVLVYLEVSYLCAKVLPLEESCDALQATSTPKFLSGTSKCNSTKRVVISSQHGQTLAFFVVNLFGLFDIGQDLNRDVAMVTSSDETIPLTSLDTKAVTTKGNAASLVIEDHTGLIIIGFQTVGCEDLAFGQDKWSERKTDFILVGCQGEEMNWSLVCVDGAWRGHVGNCSTEVAASMTDEEKEKKALKLPMEIVIMITGCLTLIIVVIVITVGCLCYRRPWKSQHADYGAAYELVESRRPSTENQLDKTIDDPRPEERTYVIQKTNSVLGTSPPPKPPDIRRYELLTLPRINPGSIKSSTDSLDERNRYSAPSSPYLKPHAHV